MGTNYYFKFENNGKMIFEKIQELLNQLEFKSLDKNSKDIEQIKEYIINTIKDNITLTFEKNTELHICKLSHGWSPLFQKTNHYKTFDELVSFYNNHKDMLTIENEYREVVEWEELIENIKEKKKEKRHISLNSQTGFIAYYVCESDYDWTEADFS